jgi:integrase
MARGDPSTQRGLRLLARVGVEAEMSFKAYPHMLRHACGYALANKGIDTRTLQATLATKLDNALNRAGAAVPSSHLVAPPSCRPQVSPRPFGDA